MKSVDIDTIRADIETGQDRVRTLQAETIHTVTFKPSGKIDVVDKERLESLNAEIDHLKDLGVHNAEVLARLTGTLGDYLTVDSVRKKKRGLEEQILKIKTLLRIDTGDLIKHGHDVDPANPYSHPKGKALKEKADADLAISEPALAAVTDLLARVETILQDFRSSGLEAGYATKDQPRAITRDKVAAFGA